MTSRRSRKNKSKSPATPTSSQIPPLNTPEIVDPSQRSPPMKTPDGNGSDPLSFSSEKSDKYKSAIKRKLGLGSSSSEDEMVSVGVQADPANLSFDDEDKIVSKIKISIVHKLANFVLFATSSINISYLAISSNYSGVRLNKLCSLVHFTLIQVDTVSRLGATSRSFEEAAVKVGNGFRFDLKHINPNLAKYPGLTNEKYANQLKEWSNECTRHLLQTYGALTESLAAYATQWDASLNAIPDLAEAFKAGEEFHRQAQAIDIRENPNTRLRTKPVTW